MSVRVECDDFSASWLGYHCEQCHVNFLYVTGMVTHQERIWDNGGRCPDAPAEETADGANTDPVTQ